MYILDFTGISRDLRVTINYDKFVVQIETNDKKMDKNTEEMFQIQPENHVEKKFKCEFCAYKTHIKRYLTDHAKKRHNISSKLFSKKIVPKEESEKSGVKIGNPDNVFEKTESKMTSETSNDPVQKENLFNFDENLSLKDVKREISIRKKR